MSLTVYEAINAMAEPFRTKALKNVNISLDQRYEKISDALIRAFMWGGTPEGHEFWNEYHATLNNMGL